jgi:hypothetical protein
LDQLRVVLEPWLGKAQFDQSPVAPKFRFRLNPEEGGAPIRLKVEINIREIEAYDTPIELPLRIENPWFSGEAGIPTFSLEEILATKLRALLQRDKGRDLYDLSHALSVSKGLNVKRTIEIFRRYLDLSNQTIPRAEAQKRMFAKLAKPRFLLDMRPLLSADQAEAMDEALTAESFRQVFTTFIDQLPGEAWARTSEMKEKFGITW